MATSVARLPRLSRVKTTGNFLIFLALGLYLVLFIAFFGPTIQTDDDRLLILSVSLLCLVFAFIIDRYFRRPFFQTISGYVTELHDRRLDTQQIAIKIDLIESLQPLTTLDSVLKEVDALHREIIDIYQRTTKEIKSSKKVIKKQHIQQELKLLLRMATESLEEIEKKRDNLLLLAKMRKILLDTVRNHFSRPHGEIDTEYLLFKTRKVIPNHDIDEVLLTRILESVLDRGELQGQLRCSETGELVLSVDHMGVETELADYVHLSWDEEEPVDPEPQFCVICRAIILVEETSTSCPSCLNQFHRPHLLEWLKVFNQCPICHKRLTLRS